MASIRYRPLTIIFAVKVAVCALCRPSSTEEATAVIQIAIPTRLKPSAKRLIVKICFTIKALCALLPLVDCKSANGRNWLELLTKSVEIHIFRDLRWPIYDELDVLDLDKL